MLLHLATVSAVLLCIAILAAWTRSYYAWDRWGSVGADGYASPVDRSAKVESWRGRMTVSYIAAGGARHPSRGYSRWGAFQFDRTYIHRRQMTSRSAPEPPRMASGPVLDGYVVGVPYWALAVASASLPAIRLSKW